MNRIKPVLNQKKRIKNKMLSEPYRIRQHLSS
jgi:hypothetical protein